LLTALAALPLTLHAGQCSLPTRPPPPPPATNACAVQALPEADTALNIRYLDVMQQLPQGKRTGLRGQAQAGSGRSTCKPPRGNANQPEGRACTTNASRHVRSACRPLGAGCSTDRRRPHSHRQPPEQQGPRARRQGSR
jgi:hypothetical protein